MNKKWLILTCFFSVATLISSILCSSLVFLNEKVRTDINSKKVLAGNNIYKSISINYETSNNIKLSGINPGYSSEYKFTITNNNSNLIVYDIVWTEITSTWNNIESNYNISHPEEFVYSLTCTNGEKTENRQMPYDEKNNIILSNLELKANKSNDCTIKITFLSNNSDQLYNLNKLFGGTYKVVIKE